jgi:flavodoxin
LRGTRNKKYETLKKEKIKMKTIMAIAMVLGLLMANAGSAAQNQGTSGKILVAYFSWGGNTRGIANQIHEQVGGDIFEIELVTPYSTNYGTVLDQAKNDQAKQARPALKNHVADMSQYDVIFLGYPNWWASIPMPIASFLEEYDFSGKNIAPFCSHGGGRFGQSLSAIAKLCPGSKILDGLSVSYSGGSGLKDDITAWLGRIGIASK